MTKGKTVVLEGPDINQFATIKYNWKAEMITLYRFISFSSTIDAIVAPLVNYLIQ